MEKDGRSMYSSHCVLNSCGSNLKVSVEGKGSGRVPETIVKCQTGTTLGKLKKKRKKKKERRDPQQANLSLRLD